MVFVCGASFLFSFQVSFASTTITENISVDTTWNIAGSPYIINKTIYLEDGKILIIEPGVIVKFKSGKNLYISGNLIANGLPGQEIVFTSYKDDEHAGDTNGDGASAGVAGYWGGVIGVLPDGMQISHAHFLYGGGLTYVLGISDGDYSFSNLIIGNSDLGAYVENASVIIDNTIFSVAESPHYGLYVFPNSTVEINNGTFLGNYGAFSTSLDTETTCNNCLIDGGHYGVIATGGGAINLNSTTISNNDYGVYSANLLTGIGTVEVHDSTFYNNSEGIKFAGENTTLAADHNWWGDASGPHESTLNPGGEGDSIAGPGLAFGDFYPWYCDTTMTTTCGPVTASVSELKQYKYDGLTEIGEGQTNMGATVSLAALVSSETPTAKVQLEIKEIDVPFDGIVSQETEFVSSGSIAEENIEGLADASYHWRARVVDELGSTSEWIEYGVVGNTDFIIHQVPHYTQNVSPYPSLIDTDAWDGLTYASGAASSGCGMTIAKCGCAMVSAVMILRYYGVTVGVDESDVNPATLNSWLQSNQGYLAGGATNWWKIPSYANNQVAYEKSVDIANNFTLLDDVLEVERPAIAKMVNRGKSGTHFVVISNKLADTYEVVDPAWYDTKTINEPSTIGKVRAYGNGFDGLRLFKPGDGLAQAYFSANIASPAELVITNSSGQKLGYDPIADVVYNEIPGATYVSEMYDDPFGDVIADHAWKIAHIPDPGDEEYDIQVIGTGSGPYTVGVSGSDSDGNFSSDEETSAIVEGEVVEYSVTYSETDGIVETQIEVTVPEPEIDFPKAIISFDTETRSLSVTGANELGEEIIVSSTEAGYVLTDPAGNTTSFDLAGTYVPDVSPIDVSLSNITYNGISSLDAPTGALHYEWKLKPDATYKLLKEVLSFSDGTYSTANFKLQKTLTTIWDTLPGGEPVKTLVGGVESLVVEINNDGTITITY